MSWQPIETAPKDDSILLFEPWNPSHRIVIGWWRPADAYNDAKWTDGCVGVAATHWMPLPDPPQEPQPTASTGAPTPLFQTCQHSHVVKRETYDACMLCGRTWWPNRATYEAAQPAATTPEEPQ